MINFSGEKFMKRGFAALKKNKGVSGILVCPGEIGFAFHALNEFHWINFQQPINAAGCELDPRKAHRCLYGDQRSEPQQHFHLH